MYLVELEKGVFIADWEGDPGRTLKIENAQKFDEKSEADYKLTQARKYRPFLKARIVCVG